MQATLEPMIDMSDPPAAAPTSEPPPEAYVLDGNGQPLLARVWLAARLEVLSAYDHHPPLDPADALTFDGYDGPDCLYWFNPFRDESRGQELELKIAREARTPSVLMTPWTYGHLADQPQLHKLPWHLHGGLFLKCSPEQWAAL